MNRKASLVLIAAVSTTATALADSRLDEVLAADRAFAAAAGDVGAQAAFQQFLADDGVLFRPTAVAGREWLQTHEEASGRLEWAPSAGAISCDGQAAVTIGPWTYRQGNDVAAGYYLTIWRKDGTTGRWQVVLDHGIDLARPGDPTDNAAAAVLASGWPDGSADDRCAKGADSSALARAERALDEAIGSQVESAALRPANAWPVLALRDEHVPAMVAGDWPTDAAVLGGAVTAVSTASVAAQGSDMGYSYGEIRARDAQNQAPGEVRAVYVRLWARDGAAWRLVVDLLTPLPQSPAASSNSPAQ